MGDHSIIRLIDERETTEADRLRHIFVRDQMAEWVKHPLVMSRAEGVYYWDVQGRRYLDALSGIYVASLGHGDARVVEAVCEQMRRLAFSPPMHGTNPLAVQLANLLAELAPGDLDAVKFATGGSEAVEAAIKLARQYHKLTGNPGKYKVIGRYLSWHGSTLGALSASGLKGRKTVNEPLAPGFVHVFPPTCYRCPFGQNQADCGTTCARIVEQVIEMEDPATVAALIVEPIGHTGGIIDPPDDYLPILREICDRHNVLLIFDEIITGAGRTGHLFAAETFGVVPDVLCLGKGISGGYAPLSALICRRPIADAFWGPACENPGFVEGHTFEGNPVACAAGIAVLRAIVEDDLCANAQRQGERLRRGLEGIADRYPVIGDVRGRGLFQGVELVADRRTKARTDGLGLTIGRRALANGLLCRFDPHWMAFGPPLIFTDEQTDELLALFERSLGEALGGHAD